MSLATAPLPTDPEALRQFAAGLQAELARKEIEITANAADPPSQQSSQSVLR